MGEKQPWNIQMQQNFMPQTFKLLENPVTTSSLLTVAAWEHVNKNLASSELKNALLTPESSVKLTNHIVSLWKLLPFLRAQSRIHAK